MKLYEIEFTFTPEDQDGVGEGLVTVAADNEDDAREAFSNFLDGMNDVEITSVRLVVDDPNLDANNYRPRTLQ